ncbi:MAG TPA: hypothetical protein VMY35_08540 [Phycisphaerae bacterium]|nr:hypothetical protein [Phycisphaerae bacterium]
MERLSRETILGAADMPFEDVEVPEWGGAVRVRTMTGAVRDEFEQEVQDRKRGKGRNASIDVRGMKARIVALTACDENGELLFGIDDIAALNAKNAKALDRLFQVASRLNGLSDEDVEDLAKNSDSGPSGAPGSD